MCKREILINIVFYYFVNMGHKSVSDTIKEVIEPLAVSTASGGVVATLLDSAVHFLIQLLFALITATAVFFFNRYLKNKFDKPKQWKKEKESFQ